jgi:hypothetical protein
MQCSDYLCARDFVESFATIGWHSWSIAAKAQTDISAETV